MSDYNEQLYGLDPGGHLGLDPEDAIRYGTSVTTLSSLAQSIYEWRSTQRDNFPRPNSSWFWETGISCEILRVSGGGWQKGKLRFRLEFVPDNPEVFEKPKPLFNEPSPLDDLRTELNLDNQ